MTEGGGGTNRRGESVLVIGYYGDGNTGDEAVLTAMLRGLRRRRPEARIVVPAYGPGAPWLEKAHGVESFHFKDLDRMLDEVDRTDLVVLGGGGLLHDYVDPRPESLFSAEHFGLTYYCGVPWLAARLGKPVALYAVGVGPLLFDSGREWTREVALAASAITVRDEPSAELLRELAGEGLALEVTADPVWRLEPEAGEGLAATLAACGATGGPWIGVAVRNWNLGIEQAAWEEPLLEGLRAFAREHGLGVLFIPFQHARTGLQNDLDLARRLAGRLAPGVRAAVFDRPVSPERLAAVIGRCELLLAMRLHAVIFGCLTGTPFVALDYDPKVGLHARMLDPAPPILPVDGLDAAALAQALGVVRRDLDGWRPRLRELAARQKRRADRNDEVVASLLETCPEPLPKRFRGRILGMLRAREEARRAAGPGMGAGSWWTPPAAGEIPRAVSPVVRLIAPAFFDPEGSRRLRGGAERYLAELVRIVRGLGRQVEVFQPAARRWQRDCEGFQVTGLPVPDHSCLEREAHRSTGARPALTIHLAFYLAGPDTPPPALGIGHGIYWDDPDSQVTPWHRERVLESVDYLDAIVSVDASTINWFAATDAPRAQKLARIPNFVDTAAFRPPEGEPQRPVILFPRRLVTARGFWLLAEIVPGLLERYPDVEVHFVGDAAGLELAQVQALEEARPGRVRWVSLPPERMPEAYGAAEIVVIPTLFSEGTSLSCLEAFACGRAVVATRVGGLPEIVLDGYNGLLVEPEAGALLGALERLLLDPALRRRLGRAAIETSRAFRIERWRERWLHLLQGWLPPAGPGVLEKEVA